MSLLLPVSAHLGDGHAGNLQLLEGAFYFIHFVRSYDRFDQFHERPSRTRCRLSLSASCCGAESLAPFCVRWNTSIARRPSVAISTRSTSQPDSDIARLIRYSRPSAFSAMISTIV